MRLHVVAVSVLLVASGGIAAGAVAQQSASDSATQRAVRLGDARLKFEINATDGDGGIQVFLDGEDWKTMSIFDPKGNRIFTSHTRGRLAKHGGTELFLESGEPPFSEVPLPQLLRRWPAGVYQFRGTGLDGETLVGSARLTHKLADGPKLVSPLEGAPPQDPRHTVVRWQRVAPPAGSRIIGYQVIVERETNLKTLPVRALDVMMPPTARKLRVPPGFLKPNREYAWEVLAIELSGNQTLSSSTFRTGG
jgi:hypothetical protein